MSYQSIVSNAADLSDHRADWDKLYIWVDEKISSVTRQ
jgi:hypothetical protein